MVEDSNSLSEVFMELAGESRYDILQMLEEQKWRSAQLAKELNLTIQETHRNTVRLADAGLIKKRLGRIFFTDAIWQNHGIPTWLFWLSK